MKDKKWRLLINILLVICALSSISYIISLKNENQIYYYRIQNECDGNHEKYIHFSIDDTIKVFDDLTKNKENYNSIFENKLLKTLKYLHIKYGAKYSLYCFVHLDNIKLEQCTEKFRQEFEDNSEWLKFGFHCIDNNTNYFTASANDVIEDYNRGIIELKRIVGEKSITTVLRLEKFIISEENIKAINSQEYPITGLLGADTKDRADYYLNTEENDKLFNEDYFYDSENNIFFYNTDLRIESISLKNLDKELKNVSDDKNLIIFTHEWMFNEYKSRIKTTIKMALICDFAVRNGYIFSFPEKM